MSARDAQARLSRRFRDAQSANDRPTAFRLDDHSELPRWPADAFTPSGKLERVTIPPNGPSQLVCDNWPECGCETDCHGSRQPLTEQQCILLLVLIAIALAGVGLIYLAMR